MGCDLGGHEAGPTGDDSLVPASYPAARGRCGVNAGPPPRPPAVCWSGEEFAAVLLDTAAKPCPGCRRVGLTADELDESGSIWVCSGCGARRVVRLVAATERKYLGRPV